MANRAVGLVADGVGVDQRLAGQGRVVAVEQPHVDAGVGGVVGIEIRIGAAVGQGRIGVAVLAVAGPDDGEVAAMVDGHRVAVVLLGGARRGGGAQGLRVTGGVSTGISPPVGGMGLLGSRPESWKLRL